VLCIPVKRKVYFTLIFKVATYFFLKHRLYRLSQ